ncbi:MAG: DNA protecting protein DprA [Thermoanaerobacterales bacterium 50_218]|nr:MAG: DNA protecting protein DprA [Thermoanaerobacterales bacterium 50_218]HAA90226.1 DNA-protecting protein DprA [Peptococcaceae bacterium]
MDDCFYWVALQTIPGVGLRTLNHLHNSFPSGEAVWKAKEAELRGVTQLSPEVVNKIIYYRDLLEPEKIAEELQKKNIRVIFYGHPDYPHYLGEIAHPPLILYVSGNFPIPEKPLLAVVGARRATPYGIEVAKCLSRELTRLGWGIVSGMARGIDTAAHEGALQESGYTIAVLGCGIDICYPRENYKLKEKIAQEGCLLTEFPLGTKPEAKNFPIRNRIISGCTLGTLVVEAEEKSGALITAAFALEQGREVFAVPGPVTSTRSRGTHALIKQGAKLVERVEDILEEFPYLSCSEKQEQQKQRESGPELSEEEKLVFQQITLDPVHLDEVASVLGFSVARVSGILTTLELKGVVRQLPGGYYIRTRVIL